MTAELPTPKEQKGISRSPALWSDTHGDEAIYPRDDVCSGFTRKCPDLGRKGAPTGEKRGDPSPGLQHGLGLGRPGFAPLLLLHLQVTWASPGPRLWTSK